MNNSQVKRKRLMISKGVNQRHDTKNVRQETNLGLNEIRMCSCLNFDTKWTFMFYMISYELTKLMIILSYL